MSDANASVETLQAELQLARAKVHRLERENEMLKSILGAHGERAERLGCATCRKALHAIDEPSGG